MIRVFISCRFFSNKIVLQVLLSLVVIAWLPYFNKPTRILKVTFFDVGQGDAIFVETPSNKQILIDGGPDKSIIYHLSRTLPFYNNTLDLIVLTHPQSDHMLGLIEVLRRYKVKAVAFVPVNYDTKAYETFKMMVKKEEAKIFKPSIGDVFDFGDGVVAQVWWPDTDIQDECGGDVFECSNDMLNVNNVNDVSVVLKLDFNDFELVLTGDAENNVQDKILDLINIVEDIEVLKIPHHGSDDSINKEFIEMVDPKLVVISVGDNNPHGHPKRELLDLLNSYPLKVLRTDEDGNITIKSDGRIWQID